MILPILYKRTKTGAVSYWEISTDGNTVIKESGQLGTSSPLMHYEDVFGKNVGRSNETTDDQQAELEARSAWLKKKDGGMKTLEDLGITDVNDLYKVLPKYNSDANGNKKPMLATDWRKIKGNLFPCLIQPKLDGVRCLMIVEDGEITFLSRSGKEYTTLKHIEEDIINYYNLIDSNPFILDGEVYSDELNFQQIISAVKKESSLSLKLHFRAYDIVNEKTQDDRWRQTLKLVTDINSDYIHFVETSTVDDADEVMFYHSECVKKGYEGAMLRLLNGVYEEGCRSRSLLKVKSFDEQEFEFAGWLHGQREEDLIAVCKLPGDKSFKAKMKGNREYKAQISKTHPKLITVEFFGWTNDKIPRFPIGKAVRDYE